MSTIPMIKDGGIVRPAHKGEVINPSFLPPIEFCDGSWIATVCHKPCGTPYYKFNRPTLAYNLASNKIPHATVGLTVPIWTPQGVLKKGQVVQHLLAYYVARGDGTLPDPAYGGASWSQGFSDYSLALIWAVNNP